MPRKFNQQQVEIVRKRKGLTKQDLSSWAGLSRESVSRRRFKTQEPLEWTVGRIASALGYPSEFFYGDDLDEVNVDSASFNSSLISARIRNTLLASGSIAFLLDDWAQQRLNLPDVEAVDIGFGGDPETAARKLRQEWGIGVEPVPHLIELIEAKGVRVFSIPEYLFLPGGYSCWRGDVPYIFLHKSSDYESRRFCTAQQLGYLVLHKHSRPNHYRNVKNSTKAFAYAFLMPKEGLEEVFQKHQPLNLIPQKIMDSKQRWGVSVDVLAYRLHQLGCITDRTYRSVPSRMTERYFTNSDQKRMPEEMSSVWSKALESHWKKQGLIHDIAKKLLIPVEEIESLLLISSTSARKRTSKSSRKNPVSPNRKALKAILRTWI
ncbi:MAG: ImmA/IrrE family metallo-endopeptidase [Gammaproteobacteria bacterium]|nr:ImmA/IrrE family metallo-endopeptidase [Gammaproteobacteria bacterium]